MMMDMITIASHVVIGTIRRITIQIKLNVQWMDAHCHIMQIEHARTTTR